MVKKQTDTKPIMPVVKKTTIGDGRISFSTMNKDKRRSYKPYNRQGR